MTSPDLAVQQSRIALVAAGRWKDQSPGTRRSDGLGGSACGGLQRRRPRRRSSGRTRQTSRLDPRTQPLAPPGRQASGLALTRGRAVSAGPRRRRVWGGWLRPPRRARSRCLPVRSLDGPALLPQPRVGEVAIYTAAMNHCVRSPPQFADWHAGRGTTVDLAQPAVPRGASATTSSGPRRLARQPRRALSQLQEHRRCHIPAGRADCCGRVEGQWAGARRLASRRSPHAATSSSMAIAVSSTPASVRRQRAQPRVLLKRQQTARPGVLGVEKASSRQPVLPPDHRQCPDGRRAGGRSRVRTAADERT